MSRSISIPYQPNIVPTDPNELPRWLDVELNKIALALIAQPVAMAVKDEGPVIIGPAINWQTLFIGNSPDWDVPGGDFNSTTGEWTCPESGLYSIDLQMEVAPFGLGNKNYYAGIAVVIDSGGTITRYESTDGGDDNIPLGVSLSGLAPLLQGDVLHTEGTIVHENQTGTVDVKIGWQVLNVSK
jgi:hypothetical protein